MVAQLNRSYVKARPGKAISRLLSYALFEGRPLTTRGRWINPFVFGLFEIERRLPQLRKVVQPIFIIGAGRSGTTVLGLLLSMHRDVGFLNEPKAMWHAIHPGGDVIGNYCKERGRHRFDSSDVTEEVRRNAHRLYGAYLFATRSKRVLDKSPELVFRVPFVREIFPDAKFLFLTRNGWDTCHSIVGWSKRKGVDVDGERHDWWGVDRQKWHLMVEELVKPDPGFQAIWPEIERFTDHQKMSLVEWIVTMREGLKQRDRYPKDVLLLRYEDLLSSPRRKLDELLEFLGLSPDDCFFRYSQETISPPRAHPRISVPPILLDLFNRTMFDLGYS